MERTRYALADKSAPLLDRVEALRRVLERAIPTIRSASLGRSYSYAAAVLVRLHPDACYPDGQRRPVEGLEGLWKTIDTTWGIGDKFSANSSFKVRVQCPGSGGGGDHAAA